MLDTNRTPLPDMTAAYQQVQEKKKKDDDKKERWQDDDGDGKWYEPGVDVKKEEFADPLTLTYVDCHTAPQCFFFTFYRI